MGTDEIDIPSASQEESAELVCWLAEHGLAARRISVSLGASGEAGRTGYFVRVALADAGRALSAIRDFFGLDDEPTRSAEAACPACGEPVASPEQPACAGCGLALCPDPWSLLRDHPFVRFLEDIER